MKRRVTANTIKNLDEGVIFFGIITQEDARYDGETMGAIRRNQLEVPALEKRRLFVRAVIPGWVQRAINEIRQISSFG